jgi:hypothetical protein
MDPELCRTDIRRRPHLELEHPRKVSRLLVRVSSSVKFVYLTVNCWQWLVSDVSTLVQSILWKACVVILSKSSEFELVRVRLHMWTAVTSSEPRMRYHVYARVGFTKTPSRVQFQGCK